MKTVYSAGLDYSCSNAAFAVLKQDGTVVFDVNFQMPSRDASRLPLLMEQKMAEYQLKFEDITNWTAGAGPGSFTGLRLAASFVKGITFRKDVKRRAVPSASALAATLNLKENRVLALYDGRKNELLAFGMKRAEDGSYVPDGMRSVISSAEQLAETGKIYGAYAVNQPDSAAVNAYLEKLPELADRVKVSERISAVGLVLYQPDDFGHSLSDLIYLRPAVFVEPKKIRSFSDI